jgi:hypothetical protein
MKSDVLLEIVNTTFESLLLKMGNLRAADQMEMLRMQEASREELAMAQRVIVWDQAVTLVSDAATLLRGIADESGDNS